ncbi:MAG TPA: DUF4249 family protein [Flavobacterium sp.]|jgi:hypothetical protein|uniref:DUF4249 family protein n=1 Tax=Flavobacterium sp. TaxID=239 RepID=UPI002C0BAB6D|nr:DUF4249 family protein [Flavobacterium sp.]MCA0349767.1 DUF4249 domain-containing protein [Bacteroidota bacterium]HPW97883.1 DUF4249 family protein [Flavobacterium sp.]HQA74977.1 DUF4249 family protein [Flavobacterium sp.]
MKTSKYILILVSFIFLSCEKVIDVGLDTAAPRLVIEASINWVYGTVGNQQKIKLSTTTDYFSNTVPPVTDAIVFITNSSNQQFNFVQDTEPGIYNCADFNPVLDETYTLTVMYKNEVYTSTEKLLNTPIVKRVEQKNDGGILGNATEVKFVFDDIPNETNHYFLKINDPYKVIPEFGVLEDRFFQNNEMFGLYFSEDLKTGDTIKFTNNGITLNYYNYMNILLSQAGGGNAGPFSTPTSTIRGNIVNQTNFDNFALGYFRLSKTEIKEYIIE